MAMDITNISPEELMEDWEESVKDAGVCMTALDLGITKYGRKSVLARLRRNEEVIDTIDLELERRQDEQARTGR